MFGFCGAAFASCFDKPIEQMLVCLFIAVCRGKTHPTSNQKSTSYRCFPTNLPKIIFNFCQLLGYFCATCFFGFISRICGCVLWVARSVTVVKQKQNDGATNFCPCNPCDGFGMDAFFFCSAAPCAQHSAPQRGQPLQPTLVVGGGHLLGIWRRCQCYAYRGQKF
jgi:hypothetical protein